MAKSSLEMGSFVGLITGGRPYLHVFAARKTITMPASFLAHWPRSDT